MPGGRVGLRQSEFAAGLLCQGAVPSGNQPVSWGPYGRAVRASESTCISCWCGAQHERQMRASVASVSDGWAAGSSSAALPQGWEASALLVLTIAQQLLQWPAWGLLGEMLLLCPTLGTGTRHVRFGTL